MTTSGAAAAWSGTSTRSASRRFSSAGSGIRRTCIGPQEAYSKIEPHDSHHENFLVIGPWNHGQWGATTRHLGAIEFGEPTTDEFRERYEAPFFAYYLKDEPGFNLKGAAAFESGANRWREYTHWPPTESKSQNLYLSADGSLVFSSSDPTNTSATKPGRRTRETNSGQSNYRRIHLRSRQSRAVPPSSDSGHLRPRFAVVYVVGGGSALRFRTARRCDVDHSAARKRRHRCGRCDCRSLCLHVRHGLRLGGKADRRISRSRRCGRACFNQLSGRA